MREIKFKAQRADGKGWVIGFYVFTSNKYHQILTGKWSNTSGSHYAYEIDPDTLCQFTGLQDKNGVDIYEGDVDENDWIVEWNEKLACFIGVDFDAEIWYFLHDLQDQLDGFVIKSNIHVNP